MSLSLKVIKYFFKDPVKFKNLIMNTYELVDKGIIIRKNIQYVK